MSDAPERIWYSPDWNLCHRTKQSYNSNADITFDIEYIRKDIAFPRISKEDIDRLEQISKDMNQDATKNIRAVWEKWREIEPATNREALFILKDAWQAIKADLEEKQ